MFNKPTSIPRIISPSPEKKSVEWGLPGQVSAAFMEKHGYTINPNTIRFKEVTGGQDNL